MAHLIGLLHSGSRGKFLAPVRALKLVLKPFDIKIKTALYADDDDGVLDDYAEELVKDGTLEAIIAAGGLLCGSNIGPRDLLPIDLSYSLQ